MNNKGFTLIELLAVIVVLAIILIIAIPRILSVIEESDKEAFKITGEQLIKGAKDRQVFNTNGPLQGKTYTITDSAFVGEEIPMSGSLPKSGVVTINEEGQVEIAIYSGKFCVLKTFEQSSVVISKIPVEECVLVSAPSVSYDGFDAVKGINAPEVATGLTPIILSGASYTNTTTSDPSWFNYDTSTKLWANAISNDGSMWVWIPRFAYQVNTNFHTNSGTGGVVNIKFLMGNSNDALDATPIGTSPTYVGSSQTNYVVHPAFTFGGVELTGFWMAKFEATMGKAPNNPGTSCVNQLDNVTTENIKIVPNIASWRCISISNAFLNSYGMQSKSAIYGWNDSQVDTHLIKNSEWSAVAYLSQSSYGKGTTNIWMNPNSNYITGCGGTAAGQSETSTCIPYNTETRTSTTGNITGVYDMSGGSSEFTAAHMDNLVVGETTYINGQALVTADSKYREIYSLGVTDTATNNYSATQSRFGDAIWETSLIGDVDNNAYYLDSSLMPFSGSPWFVRGAFNRSFNGAGLFAFSRSAGGGAPDFSFRPVLLVETGL